MVDLALLQSVSYIAGAFGVCLAAIFYILNLRISQKNQELSLRTQQQTLETRQAQLFMQIYQITSSPSFAENEQLHLELEVKDMNDWNRVMKDKKLYTAWSSYGVYLEGLGVLVRENLIDIRLPALLYSGSIQWYWEKFGPGIKMAREALNYPRIMIEAEYLYNKINEYARQHPELQIAAPTSRDFTRSS